MLVEFILGIFIVNSLLILWFFSPIKITLSKILFKVELLPIDFDEKINDLNSNLGTLLSCWICLSFWLSLLVGFFLMLLYSLDWYFPITTFLGYPSICYLYKKIIMN